MSTLTLPLGIRQNNPLNIRPEPVDTYTWVGEIGTSHGFLEFETPEHGIRAAAKTLQTYYEKYQINTLRGIIARWAPAGDNNDVDTYVENVERWANLWADQQLDLLDYATVNTLLRAMTRQECGVGPMAGGEWYDAATWERGLRMAGLTPNKPLVKSRTAQGQVAATAGGVGLLVAFLKTVWPEGVDQLDALEAIWNEHGAAIIAVVIGIAGVVRTVLARIDDKQQGRL